MAIVCCFTHVGGRIHIVCQVIRIFIMKEEEARRLDAVQVMEVAVVLELAVVEVVEDVEVVEAVEAVGAVEEVVVVDVEEGAVVKHLLINQN